MDKRDISGLSSSSQIVDKDISGLSSSSQIVDKDISGLSSSSQIVDKDISGLSSSNQTAEGISGMDTLIARHKVKQETKPAAKQKSQRSADVKNNVMRVIHQHQEPKISKGSKGQSAI